MEDSLSPQDRRPRLVDPRAMGDQPAAGDRFGEARALVAAGRGGEIAQPGEALHLAGERGTGTERGEIHIGQAGFLAAVDQPAGKQGVAAGSIADDRWAAFLLVCASLAGLGGFQAAKFAQLAEAWSARGITDDQRREWALERQLVTAGALLLLGLVLALRPLVLPFHGGVGLSLRWIVPGMALVALAFQVASFAFFVHLLGLRRG